ncbi:hypothetical protein F5051DRAFT_430908 [Lentinula edodes]|nr:hypothetical protein F5051DRAFT_430908 [Lentinula edodes]
MSAACAVHLAVELSEIVQHLLPRRRRHRIQKKSHCKTKTVKDKARGLVKTVAARDFGISVPQWEYPYYYIDLVRFGHYEAKRRKRERRGGGVIALVVGFSETFLMYTYSGFLTYFMNTRRMKHTTKTDTKVTENFKRLGRVIHCTFKLHSFLQGDLERVGKP